MAWGALLGGHPGHARAWPVHALFLGTEWTTRGFVSHGTMSAVELRSPTSWTRWCGAPRTSRLADRDLRAEPPTRPT